MDACAADTSGRRGRCAVTVSALIATCTCLASWVGLAVHSASTAEKPKPRTQVAAPASQSSAQSKPPGAQTAAPPGSCLVLPFNELLITDLSVVEDARTQNGGPWSFEYLIANMCPAEQSPSDFVLQFFENWMTSTSQSTTDFFNIDLPRKPSAEAAATRTAAIAAWIDAWPRTGGGALDFSQTPFRLNAIINRIDLGEGRFTFGFLRPDGAAIDCTLIIEYTLPVIGPNGENQDWNWWAHQWHQLSSMKRGSDQYLSTLESITRQFTARGLAPAKPNGSALGQLRVVEQLSDTDGEVSPQESPAWELREFHLSPITGQLTPFRCAKTPHFDYDAWPARKAPNGMDYQQLGSFLMRNQQAILANTLDWDDQNAIELAIAAPATSPFFKWLSYMPTPPDIAEQDWQTLTQAFGQQTCNGCHTGNGSAVDLFQVQHIFNHISNRDEGKEATLSHFLNEDIVNNRIPNVLSYVCPDNPYAIRIDPRRRPVH